MKHKKQSPLSGKTVKIKENVNELGNQSIIIEDWWDCVSGMSWMAANGNPACMNYAIRTGASSLQIPIDDEVLYGKIKGLGYLVHKSELEN